MTMTISSTTKVVSLNGIECRIWEGETAAGVRVHAFIPRVGADRGQDLSQFEVELKEQKPPSPEMQVYPLRMIS